MRNTYSIKKKYIKWEEIKTFLKVSRFDENKAVIDAYMAEAFSWEGQFVPIEIYREEVEYNGKILLSDVLSLYELRYKEEREKILKNL